MTYQWKKFKQEIKHEKALQYNNKAQFCIYFIFLINATESCERDSA